MQKSFGAWAIDTQSKEGHGYLGRYWPFEDGVQPMIPAHLEGCRMALFKTRAVARKQLDKVRRSWPSAVAVGVTVNDE